MIERIHWIEKLKKTGKSLDEIRALLQVETLVEEEIDIQEIRLQMRKLEKDVVTLMGQMDEKQIQQMKKGVARKCGTDSITIIACTLGGDVLLQSRTLY